MVPYCCFPARMTCQRSHLIMSHGQAWHLTWMMHKQMWDDDVVFIKQCCLPWRTCFVWLQKSVHQNKRKRLGDGWNDRKWRTTSSWPIFESIDKEFNVCLCCCHYRGVGVAVSWRVDKLWPVPLFTSLVVAEAASGESAKPPENVDFSRCSGLAVIVSQCLHLFKPLRTTVRAQLIHEVRVWVSLPVLGLIGVYVDSVCVCVLSKPGWLDKWGWVGGDSTNSRDWLRKQV